MYKKLVVSKIGLLALLSVLFAFTIPDTVIAGSNSCDNRVNNTQKKLQECVTVDGVRDHQAALQDIRRRQ